MNELGIKIDYLGMLIDILKGIFIISLSAIILICSICFLYPKSYGDVIRQMADKYGLEESLVYAVVHTESRFNKRAESSKGAKGLMQVMDKTGEWAISEIYGDVHFSPEMLYEPATNIEIGCWYLDRLITAYKDVDMALAAYNAGSGNVAKWINNPDYFDGESLYNIPFPETNNFVERVNRTKRAYEFFRGL